jgi:hypothetical protein
MLQQFSWKTFLIYSAVLTALWYIGLLFTVYRREALAIILGSGLPPSAIAKPEADVAQSGTTGMETEIMGSSRMPEGLEVVSMGALSFSAPEDQALDAAGAKSEQLGLIPDVLQELREIFGILAKEDGTKQDFFSLAAMISEKYGRIGSNPNIGKINEFIRDHAPFSVNMAELENLWDQ